MLVAEPKRVRLYGPKRRPLFVVDLNAPRRMAASVGGVSIS
jgi:hypothetical protein